MPNLHELLDGKWDKGNSPKDLFEKFVASKSKAYVSTILDGLTSKSRRVESGCAELASLVSEKKPEVFYAHFEIFKNNLSAKEPCLRWEAACVVGNLASVDKAKKTPQCIPELTTHLKDKSIVLQLHCLRALTKIAVAHPEKAPKILVAIIKAKPSFTGNRVGFIAEALESFADNLRFRKKILDVVIPMADHEIESVAKKARRVLKRMDRE